MATTQNIGLIFSGGGSRGSYQIGVWQALQELGLAQHITAVYGTSVGAINGAAFVQGNIAKAINIWQQLDFTNVFADIPTKKPFISNRKVYLQWMKGSIRNRGLDVTPLKKLIRQSLDEEFIRQSSKDFGMVVFNLTNKRAKYLEKNDIPEGQLIEYIIASATFPVFKPHKISEHLFLDGGIYDNRPLEFFKNKDNIDKVIVVDVTMARHLWPNKGRRSKLDMHYVRPSRLLGSPMSFRKKRINSNLELGYNDAMSQLADL